MRPSICPVAKRLLASSSGVDGKLGLTMLRPSLQSAPELPAWHFTNDRDLWPFELTIGTPVTPALGNVYTDFILSMPYCCVS